MNKYITTKILIFACCIGLFLTSCKHKNEYHSIIDKIEAESINYDGVSVTSERFLEEIETIKIREDGHTFLIPERKSQIKSYECSECHSKPLHEVQKDGDGRKAHWDLNLKHADSKIMNCATCHNPDDMDNLKSLTGHKIDFNNSYNLCSQCHSKQFDDWKGGAHGKKIGGWAPPRASLTCVNCHNPHNPSFDSRWPAQFNTQKVKERK